MLLAEQRSRFVELRARLDIALRERGEHEQRLQRWTTDTRRALAEARAGLTAAAEQGTRQDLIPLSLMLQQLKDARPAAPANAELDQALAQALHSAAGIDARLAWLDAANVAPPLIEPAVPAASAAETAPEPVEPQAPAAASSTHAEAGDTGAAVAQAPADGSADVLAAQAATASDAQPVAAQVPGASADLPSGAAVAGSADAPPTVASPAPAAAPAPAPAPAPRWNELPPLADVALARLLEQRHERWLAARQAMRKPARPVEAAAPVAPAARPERVSRVETLGDAQRQQVESLVALAEAALADGRLAELQQQLGAIDHALGPVKMGALPEALRDRLLALRAEGARLKSWQQWGGGRARDELTEEAESLARQTQAISAPQPSDTDTDTDAAAAAAAAAAGAEADAETVAAADAKADAGAGAGADVGAEADAKAKADAGPGPGPGADPVARPRLDLKAQRESIQALRQRWKELDRLGAPASQSLWQRFDAALQIASAPVAAQHAALAATRQANLAARVALLMPFEALALPGEPSASAADVIPDGARDDGARDDGAQAVDQAGGSSLGAAGAGVPADLHGAGDWKTLVRELSAFQAAWRKFGPVEHTVPADARAAVQQRCRAAVERIEAPLNEARRAAVAQREQLIAQAQALIPSADSQRPLAEAARLVRALQADWQEHARSLPLARGVENDLWSRFKAATDAVFAQRDALFAAREAEQAANLVAVEALLARLSGLGLDTPRPEIVRILADADRAWRVGGELPRGALDAVERRFRSARAAAVELLDAGERLRWQAQCDTLAARLALCEQREAGPADALQQRWSALAALPAPWDQALADRWTRATDPGPLAGPAVDELLLQLEAALDVATAPRWQAERRALKLRALKDAMEGRRPDGPAQPAQPTEWLQALLRQAGLSAEQRERLQAVIAALRQAAPGALGSPVTAV
jgi:hypothetical protein